MVHVDVGSGGVSVAELGRGLYSGMSHAQQVAPSTEDDRTEMNETGRGTTTCMECTVHTGPVPPLVSLSVENCLTRIQPSG